MHVAQRSAEAEKTAKFISDALARDKTALDEWESKSLFAAYGIAVPRGALASSQTEAVQAAEGIGGRVAMKAIGSDIHHKTEAGLVMLGIEGAEEVAAAYRLLEERAAGALEAVLVEQMVAGNREFMVGLTRDPAFGPMVAFGLGGVLTEALGDIALAVTPMSDSDARELPDLIKARRLLGPFRGYPPVDREELGKAIKAIAQIALDHPNVVEIDVNPLLVEGGHPVAADALIILSAEKQPEPAERAFTPNLKAALAPRSVAIVGASEDVVKWGGSALRNILDGGYDGKIYPVNPKGGTIFGLEAYPSLADLPETPDLALLAVGGKQIAPTLEQCAARGIPAAVAIAAGFSETGEQGAEAEREIARIATEGNVTLIGPNCMGLISNERRLHATGFIVVHPKTGKLSVASQSGNIGVQMTKTCERRGIGVDKFVSVGNEAQVGALDVLDYLRDDPATECALLYLEGIDDGRKFLESTRAATKVKPVVVVRGGLTEFGSKAAASHTGAMAGSAAVFFAAARQTGVVTCTSTQEVLDLGLAFAYLPLPKGRRIAVVTNGGGVGVLMADEVARNDLTLAELPASVFEEVDALLPPFYSRRNPLDMVASAGGEVGPKVLRAVAKCDCVDAIVVLSVLGVPNAGDDVRPTGGDGSYLGFSPWETNFMEVVAELMVATGKPIINVPDIPLGQAMLETGGRYSPIALPSPRSAAQVLDRMAWYAEYRKRQNLT
ncbi:MAG: acetate--CoA ligase family protein [Actinobacteria bacterium]|nr:acetate--CoA ligase family protein [Actinomycetota bacterium]